MLTSYQKIHVFCSLLPPTASVLVPEKWHVFYFLTLLRLGWDVQASVEKTVGNCQSGNFQQTTCTVHTCLFWLNWEPCQWYVTVARYLFKNSCIIVSIRVEMVGSIKPKAALSQLPVIIVIPRCFRCQYYQSICLTSTIVSDLLSLPHTMRAVAVYRCVDCWCMLLI